MQALQNEENIINTTRHALKGHIDNASLNTLRIIKNFLKGYASYLPTKSAEEVGESWLNTGLPLIVDHVINDLQSYMANVQEVVKDQKDTAELEKMSEKELSGMFKHNTHL
jgi:hypothetical protein